jgi:kinetochore protein Spc7/SPC105
MASQERSLPPRPRLRKSIAHMPSPETKAGMTDKENMTTDLGALSGATRVGRSQKSSRSKSVGPGGLDALLEGSNTGNRRQVSWSWCWSFVVNMLTLFCVQSVATAQLRSILKPTVPLSPLREIPTRKDLGLGNGQTTPRKTGNKSRASPGKKSDHVSTDVPFSGAEGLPNPFQSAESPKARGTKVSLRTEEEQQAAARVREEQERREEEKREILARRDARRKSLGMYETPLQCLETNWSKQIEEWSLPRMQPSTPGML